MIDQDARPIYSDVGEFTRGRSGYRPDPKPRERVDAWWALIAIGIIVGLFVLVHAIMPTVR